MAELSSAAHTPALKARNFNQSRVYLRTAIRETVRPIPIPAFLRWSLTDVLSFVGLDIGVAASSSQTQMPGKKSSEIRMLRWFKANLRELEPEHPFVIQVESI